MLEGPWEVLGPCINQDTKKRHKKGDTIRKLSITEFSRLSAFGFIKRSFKRGLLDAMKNKQNKNNLWGKPTEKAIDKRPAELRTHKAQMNKKRGRPPIKKEKVILKDD